MTYIFQPTLPVRGATRFLVRIRVSGQFQPTLPVRGATTGKVYPFERQRISTHAPRAGSDRKPPCLRRVPPQISTHAPRFVDALRIVISTHAPRAGSDNRSTGILFSYNHFNPRSPCGERPLNFKSASCACSFQPTLPVRGATASTNKFETLILYHKYNFGIIPRTIVTKWSSANHHSQKSSNTFGANPLYHFCLLQLRIFTESKVPLANRTICIQNAQSGFHSDFQDSRIAGCPFLDP